MSRRLRAALAAPLVASVLLPVSAAHASDRGLQRTVIREENLTIPVSLAFVREAQAYAKDPSATPDALLNRTGTFRHRLQAFKNAVTPIDPVSAESISGKKQILTSVREYDIGLANYVKALKIVQSGNGTRKSIDKDLRTAAKRIDAAGDDEAAALKKLHIGRAS